MHSKKSIRTTARVKVVHEIGKPVCDKILKLLLLEKKTVGIRVYRYFGNLLFSSVKQQSRLQFKLS